MNTIYRLVWNAARGAFVVACEFATSTGKGKNGSRRKDRTAGNESTGTCTTVREPDKARTKSTGSINARRRALALAFIVGVTGPAFSQVGSIIPGVPVGAPGSGGNTGNPGIWVNDSMTGGCLVAYDSISGNDQWYGIGPSTYKNYMAGCDATGAMGAGAYNTQTNRTLFFGDGTSAVSLSLGKNLYVNGGHMGLNNNISGDMSMEIGNDATSAAGSNAIAMGNGAKSSGVSALAMGASAQASNTSTIAIGAGAHASAANSVALGANSATTSNLSAAAYKPSATATVAGTAPVGEVSLGSAGAERRITNVAAGSAGSDAVNVSQLQALDSKMTTTDAGSVKYDTTGGVVNHNSVTLGGTTYNNSTHTGGTTITNVADGVAPSDAVNMSQLTTTNNNVSNLSTTVSDLGATVNNFAGDQSATFITNNGSGIKYVRTNDTGLPADDAHAQVAGATAVGYRAQASAADSLALGRNAQASAANSVALGANSTTTASMAAAAYNPNATAILVGTAPVGEVSVGSTGAERRVTNVAAGSAGSDAVNVSQLQALDSKIATTDAGSVKYDTTGGVTNYNHITLGGATYDNSTHTGGTTITNVADGVAPSDAVNMSQLTTTNNNVSNLSTTVNNFAGDQSASYITNNGSGIKYVRTNDTGLAVDDAHASGQGATAVGYNAQASGLSAVAIGRNSVASHGNSVALGAGSATTVGARTDYAAVGLTAPQSSTGEVNVGGRQITGVAAGAGDTDAVNVAQLKGVVGAATADAVIYDSAAHTSITLGGPVSGDGGVTGGTKITNVAQGDVSAASTDAVNGSQLYVTNQAVNQLDGRVTNVETAISGITNISAGKAGMFQTSADSAVPQPAATGTNSAAGGAGSVASGSNSLAVGNGSNATAANTVAIGTASKATADNSVAIGHGSVADRANTVSVGVAGAERQVTNVAAGTQATDAVNVGQLKAAQAGSVQYDSKADGSINYNSVTLNQGGSATAIHNVAAGTASTDAANVGQLNDAMNISKDWAKAYTDQQVGRMEQEASAGTAAAIAMAGLPQAYRPNQSSVGAALGTYRGQAGIAVGLSTITESGRYVLKASGTANTKGHVGVSVGAGLVW